MISVQDLGGAWTLRVAEPELWTAAEDRQTPVLDSVPPSAGVGEAAAGAGEAAALAGRDLAATVPGCVHTDLRASDLIPDPFLDDNEHAVAWIGHTDWVYHREIAWPGAKPERIDLVFDGLDTVAAIELDGQPLGTTRNMHRSYRFDVTDLIAAEPTPLRVHFTSAYAEADAVREMLRPRPNAYPEPFNFVRKMACSFGWDWGPTLVTAGIWRPVRLEGWSTARLATVRPLTTWDGAGGRLDLTVEAERTGDEPLEVRVLLDGREVARGPMPSGESGFRLGTAIAGVRPWQPIGYGEQPLYDLTVELRAGEALLDRWQRRTGFRRAEIDRMGDATGHGFTFRINNESVLVKGVNWIPDDIFPARMTRERYERRLREAAAAGVNLIRVWGGGLYEDRDFYEVCDEIGLMVWQDFLFACACYPEEEPLASEVDAEARENVTRLAVHPSLVTWSGNNENLWLHGASGWAAQPGGELSWGENYYLRTLLAIVGELDPSRPYQAGSPWSGSWKHDPNDPDHMTFHSWNVWNRQDYGRYRDSSPRFVAEFGWQAPPAWRTLRDSVSDEPLRPDSKGVLHHQKAEDGNGKLARGLAPHFPVPVSAEAWHYLTQLNQVRAIRTGVEHWRSHWPYTGGTILWQLNDLWPVTSWAAIDGAGRYKPLYFELGALYAPRGLTIQPRDGALAVAVLNDSPTSWSGDLTIARQASGGDIRAARTMPVTAAARAVTLVPIPPDVAADLAGAAGRAGRGPDEFLVARLDDARALWFGVPDLDFAYPDAGLTVTAEPVPGGLDVRVEAAGLARDVLVQADRIHPHAVADRGFLTLLPGESATILVSAPAELDPALIKAPWVLTDLATVLRQA